MKRDESATTPAPAVTGFPLDQDLILLDRRNQRLFALNSTAATVWRGLAAGRSVAELGREIGDLSGVHNARVVDDVQRMVDEWRGAGLLDAAGERDFGEVPAVDDDDDDDDGEAFEEAPDTGTVVGFERTFRVMDAGVRVVGDAELLPLVERVFARAGERCEEALDAWPVLTVHKSGERWIVSFDGDLLGDCARPEELEPLLHGTISMLVYHSASCFAAIHGAAVARGSECVLMPGTPGSGKSTLTAALVAEGYSFCTDDLAIMDEAPPRLRPVPLPIGLKRGSWDVVERFWPGLHALPVHRRHDGQLVKYLMPPVDDPGDRRLSIRALVFPVYDPGCRASLRPIPRSEALVRMTHAGYDLVDAVDEDAIRTLVEWFQTISCHELHFDDLSEAVSRFSEVLG